MAHGAAPWLRLIGTRRGRRVGLRRIGADTPIAVEPSRDSTPWGTVVRKPGHDHVPHDPTRPWRGNISASVSAPARRGRCPDRLEDLLRRRRDATRVGPARPMAHGRGVPGRRLHTALYPRWRRSLSWDRGCSVHLFRHRDERTVRVGGRSPERILAELGASGGSVVSVRTKADDRDPCRVLQCDRRFGGDVSPIGVVLLPSGLLLYLFDGVEEGRGRRSRLPTYRRSWPTETSSCRPPD